MARRCRWERPCNSMSPTPEGTDRPAVTWATTDPAILVVDEDGLVTTVGAGRAYLVATACADVDSADIDVFELVDPISSEWNVSEGQILLEIGSAFQLELIPVNASASSPPPFRWSREDASIAPVDDAGLVRAVSPGKTAVAAVFEDGSGSVALVDVFEVGGLPKIRLSPSDVTLLLGEFVTFEVVRDSAATAIYGNSLPSWGFTSVGIGEVLRFHRESREGKRLR